ncbi:MAG TPA: 3-dehydroquinate synthase [Steroidobacteraceae bacterium]|nr:3-dehydroquinate synthase [Steroidobacteraceae bacterium]
MGAALLGNRELIESQIPGGDLMVVTDATVAPLYLARLRAALGQRNVAECILPPGEQHKTLETVSGIFDALVGKRLNRDGVVLALGGGVVGDIAGFAAACYQRGIGYVQLPTTLLAQVDSSVGGKTGVNHPGGKNLIGAFHQPLAVLADTDTLKTLPDRELSAGLAEVIKYGCVWDPQLLDWLERNVDALRDRDAAALAHAIHRSCAIKAAVVGKDERERDLRAILNFGHTFGHAIEAATGYQSYLHGEAVALGMIMAADLSQRLGMIDAAMGERIAALVRRAGLPTAAPRIGRARALQLMRMDKKVLSGTIRLVLLEGAGRAAVVSSYPPGALEATLEAHFG